MRESLGQMLEKDFVATLDLSRDGLISESEFVTGWRAFAEAAFNSSWFLQAAE